MRISDWSSDVCSSDLGLTICRIVGSYRGGFSVTGCTHAPRRNPFTSQESLHRFSPPLREPFIIIICSRIIGMPLNTNGSIGMLLQSLGKALQFLMGRLGKIG